MNLDEFRRHGHAVVDLLADHLDELPRRPPWTPVPPDRRQSLTGQELRSAGRPFDHLLRFVADEVLPYPFGNGHPRFFAWGNSPPALEGVLADFIAAAMNPSCAGGDHAAIYLEQCTTRWVAELVGYPGDGVLVSGGADGALTALAAARHRAAIRDGWDDLAHGVTTDRAGRYRLYASTETHSCQRKAARLLGLGDNGVHLVPVDRAGRLDLEALVTAMRDDRAAGLRPFCVVANAGTVSTGAVDPLAAIAELCEGEQLWFHIDGSLGGFGILDARRRPLFDGLERADSLVLDPHKWLSVPVDCAAVFVRDLDDLRDTFSLVPPYLRSAAGEEPWYSEYVYDQTRPFRALKLWSTLAGVGRDGIAERITRNIDHAARLAEQIESSDELELVAEPTLNVVAFRHAGGEDVNRALPGLIGSAGDVYLRGTVVNGAEALRACFMHHATTTDDVDHIVPAVLRAARRLVSG